MDPGEFMKAEWWGGLGGVIMEINKFVYEFQAK